MESDDFHYFVQATDRYIAQIEAACNEANEMMDRGVLILLESGVPIMVQPHVSVPYGEMHLRPSPFDPM